MDSCRGSMAAEVPVSTVVESFPVGPLGCNCTIVGDTATGKAAVIDPGGDVAEIQRRLADHGLEAVVLLHTHAHIDHILATRAMHEATGARIELHEGDLQLYEGLRQQALMLASWGMPIPTPDEPLPVGRFLVDGEEVSVGDLGVEVMHTPGHTEGSCCFSFQGPERPTLIAGDTLFRGSVGRTDLPGGDADTLRRSIQKRIYQLPEETLVVTGHGDPTEVGLERRTNPFVRA